MAQRNKFLKAAAEKMPLLVKELEKMYPDAVCSLNYETPFQLLISTQLSAQCTDARVNMVTPALFARFPDAESFAAADVTEIEELIRSTGFYRNKAKNIKSCSKDVKRSKEVVCSLLLFCYLLADSCLVFLHLRQGRVQIVVLAHIVVKQAAVVLGHIQCAVTHQLLQSKGIAATVHKVFLCKGVSVTMNTSSLNSTIFVVMI